ncbi:hypothetical protein DERP_006070 [Dermatophagoides pteronyssinus]|uniref:Uncharacterized protein n=1 Tax=Dermatophagoides pteronyssinus TaxID=6956 RepID=A0ABQ8JSD9_DERPT|nr:hypothetical protein DERP_006070 [Dermatophagoides pteronyssinus]
MKLFGFCKKLNEISSARTSKSSESDDSGSESHSNDDDDDSFNSCLGIGLFLGLITGVCTDSDFGLGNGLGIGSRIGSKIGSKIGSVIGSVISSIEIGCGFLIITGFISKNDGKLIQRYVNESESNVITGIDSVLFLANLFPFESFTFSSVKLIISYLPYENDPGYIVVPCNFFDVNIVDGSRIEFCTVINGGRLIINLRLPLIG